MLVQDIFYYAINAIRRKKTRKILAILGVTVGIAAIVSLTSLSQGFQSSVKTQLQKGFSSDTVIVTTQSTDFLETESDFQLYFNDTALINRIENVKDSVALIQKTCFIRIGGREISSTVVGVDFEKYRSIYAGTFRAEKGALPTENSSYVAVVGARIYDPWENGTTFGEIESEIVITWKTRSGLEVENKTLFRRLSAVLSDMGSATLGGPSDSSVYIPIEVARGFFDTDEVRTIVVQLMDDTEAKVDETSEAIEKAFGGSIRVVTPKAVLNAISSIVSTIELFLTGISAISLFVAGVGIMNIMLTSVMERTREIGILKAIGVFRRTVLAIFLSEALIIGLVGSATGILLGMVISIAIDQFELISGLVSGTQNTLIGEVRILPVFSPQTILLSVFFGVAVSAIFGLYPAWRASRLNPVDALRKE